MVKWFKKMTFLSSSSKNSKILVYEKLASTQEKLKEIIRKREAKPWLVVLAKEQTAGYGKLKRFWYSPRGGLYFSVTLPKSNIEDLELLTFLAAFVIAKIIKEKFFLEPYIKLPNDVYLNGKKVAGILTENVFKGEQIICSIMGIGLNTNIEKFPPELEKIATSLIIEGAKNVKNDKILMEILKGLKEVFLTISS